MGKIGIVHFSIAKINKSDIFNTCENSIEIIKEIEDIPSYKKYS